MINGCEVKTELGGWRKRRSWTFLGCSLVNKHQLCGFGSTSLSLLPPDRNLPARYIDKCGIFSWLQLNNLLNAVGLQLRNIINDLGQCEDCDHLNELLAIIVGDLTRLDKIYFPKLINLQDYF